MGHSTSGSAPVLTHSVLVLGRTGMLGHACTDRLQALPAWTVAGTQRLNPDAPHYLDAAASSDGLQQEIASGRWQYIVNAIGVLRSLIDVQDVESVRRAIRINAVLPYEVAAAAARCGARVIHVSTDAVFGRSADQPYTESDAAAPEDFYGRTKVLGECGADNVLNLRCSIVGRDPQHGRGLVEWLLAAAAGSTVSGFVDYSWSVATTVQVADLCAALIEPGVFDRLRQQSSVYHFAPNPPISKFEFLRTLADVSGHDVTVTPKPNPGGTFRRTLATAFSDFQKLSPEPRPWKEVLTGALGLSAPLHQWPSHDKDTRS
jgi:dTDP-4-dehydrorhamnose reductase